MPDEPSTAVVSDAETNSVAPPPLFPPLFPVDTYREAAIHLRRPFDLHAVQFRALEGSGGERLNCAAYITARTASERLNLVCPHLWSDRYEPVAGGLRCDLTIGEQTRSDVGWSANTNTAMDLKALYSDAFKRAAVKFGVGVSLYALPRLVLEVRAQHAWAKALPEKDKYGNTKYRYGITPAGMRELRARYERWLAVQGFGEVLGHDHLEGSADPEDEGNAATDEPEGSVLAGEGDIKTLKEAAKGLLFPQVRMCFVAAGIPAPERKQDCFATVGRDAVAPLAKALKEATRRPQEQK